MRKAVLFLLLAVIAAGCDSGGGGGQIQPLSGMGKPATTPGGPPHPMPGAQTGTK